MVETNQLSVSALALIVQTILNIAIVVRHIRLKRLCEYHITMLHDWCHDLERRQAQAGANFQEE